MHIILLLNHKKSKTKSFKYQQLVYLDRSTSNFEKSTANNNYFLIIHWNKNYTIVVE